jgi:hypothetical protein
MKKALLLAAMMLVALGSNAQTEKGRGAQARLCPSLIPLFPRDIKDEKRNEGKKGRTR